MGEGSEVKQHGLGQEELPTLAASSSHDGIANLYVLTAEAWGLIVAAPPTALLVCRPCCQHCAPTAAKQRRARDEGQLEKLEQPWHMPQA